MYFDDFIDMENPNHIDELFHVLKKQISSRILLSARQWILCCTETILTLLERCRPVIEDLMDLQKAEKSL